MAKLSRPGLAQPRWIAATSLVWLGVLAVGGACSRDQRVGSGRARPDVLLVTIDTLRADHLGCYGYRRDTSPTIDLLAAEGALADVAYAPMGATSPSHATLFTGDHPVSHGVVRNGFSLAEEERTLAEILSGTGYRTAGFVSAYPVSHRFGFSQGFDHFDDDFDRQGESLPRRSWGGKQVDGAFDRRGERTVGAFEGWLQDHALEPAPLFLWVHLFDPHEPYDPPPAYRGRLEQAEAGEDLVRLRYDEEILYADSQLRRAVEALRRLRPGMAPLIVVTADHGEGLGDHGWPTHNRFTYEEEIRIPLVVHWPGRVPPARLPQPFHLIDIVSTLIGLLELDVRVEADGIDLSSQILGDAPPDPERSLFVQRPYYRDGRPNPEITERGWGIGLRRGRWKYFEAPEDEIRELYDLERDPRERHNLVSREPERARVLSDAVRAWHQGQLSRSGAPEGAVPADAERGLRALGYLEEEPESLPSGAFGVGPSGSPSGGSSR